MILGTIAAGPGVSTTIESTFLPQFISFDPAAAPTSIRINVLGDGVIYDVTAAAIPALRTMRYFGQVNATRILLPVANGLVKGKNVQITIVNAGAAFTLYGSSIKNNGNVYIQALTQNVLASSGTFFSKFAFLILPSMVTADIMNIMFQDGLVQQTDVFELPTLLQLTQGPNAATVIALDNFDGRIKTVQFTPAAAQLVFMVRFSAVGDVSQGF